MSGAFAVLIMTLPLIMRAAQCTQKEKKQMNKNKYSIKDVNLWYNEFQA